MVDRGFGLELEGTYGDMTVTKSEFDPNFWNQAESVDFKLNDEPVTRSGGSRMNKRARAGIMKPTKGEVLIGGKSYAKNEIDIKKEISFLSGNTKLYKDISPVELLKLCASYYDMDKDTLDKRIDEVVKKFNMESFKNQRIGSLSTGQSQRVGVSRCVLHDPHYYIFDEATSGLDIISSQVILDFIKDEKKRGKCIIYSTHYMEEAENICDRVVLINKGKVIAIGTPEEILKKTNTSNIRDAFLTMIGGAYNEME